MPSWRAKIFDIGGELSIVLLLLIIIAGVILLKHMGDVMDVRCLESGVCEFVADEDGDPVIRVKPRSEADDAS